MWILTESVADYFVDGSDSWQEGDTRFKLTVQGEENSSTYRDCVRFFLDEVVTVLRAKNSTKQKTVLALVLETVIKC